MTPSILFNPLLPPHARFALEALSFSPPQHRTPVALSDVDWGKLLPFCDRTQLTLPLGLRRAHAPRAVIERVDRNLLDNSKRWNEIKHVFRRLTAALESAGLDFLVLKGFSHCPLFIEDPRFRVQYDLDLLFPRAALTTAYEVLRRLGYEPLRGFDNVPLDHLPAMVKKTGWTWRGDYYDVELPLSIELHFRLWDDETEGFEIAGLESFWERREQRIWEEIHFSSLDSVDMIGYATLHLIRHLLRGDVRLFHVYEIACLLHRTSDDTHFWEGWRNRHHETLRRVSLISFALARRWFDCTLPSVVNESMRELPGEVCRWLRTYGDSPVTGLFRPNKHELWLHWNLISSPHRRMGVMARRLIPERLAGPVDPVHLTKEQLTWSVRWRARCRYFRFMLERVLHHVRTLPETALGALRWFSGKTAAAPR